ncbi:hypothetical protein ACTVKL_03385, partial [Serratia marcescens]|uniref:hypothetical protein n=1 Tax=Serratia marcescens TaxID=615 RepID=UPI003FA73FB4
WYSWIYKLLFRFHPEETWPVSLLRLRSWRRKDGGGGRIIRHFVPHPSGRAKARYPSLSDSL